MTSKGKTKKKPQSKTGIKKNKTQAKKQLNRMIILIASVIGIGFGVTAFLWGRKQPSIPVIEIYPTDENINVNTESVESTPVPTEDVPVKDLVKEVSSKGAEGAVGPVTSLSRPVAEKLPPLVEGKDNILIIIDDVGYNLFELRPFLQIPGPVVFAILPGVPYSKRAAKLICESGKECIIHQPMEAMSVQNLGENPILSAMDEAEIIETMERSIADVPGALGMNNHMGSKITSNEDKMDIILKTLIMHDMVFIDSLTISDSAVKKVAANLHLPYLHREIFLDNEQTEEYYTAAFNSGLEKAHEEDLIIMIGHVWADGLADTLIHLCGEAEKQGVSFIPLKDLSDTVLRYAGSGN